MLAKRPTRGRSIFGLLSLAVTLLVCGPNPVHAQDELDIAQTPLFLERGSVPLVMLVMGRDHKFYYEAYNDASDLNNDDVIDVGYKPDDIEYFGYFNSYQCYSYSGGVFSPTKVTDNKTCGGKAWSGDFLNYVTTSRMDALRKVLYGGYRSSDTGSATILERSFIPQDAHSWAKEYKSVAEDGYDISDYTPYEEPPQGTRHLFANVTLRNDNSQRPLLRVLTNSTHRAWEWVSIERPVADSKCNDASNRRVDCEKSADPGGPISESGAPESSDEFANWVDRFERPENLLAGPKSIDQIDDGNLPAFDGQSEDYLNLVRGTIRLSRGNPHTFAVDSDDAIELLIDGKPIASRFGLNPMVCTTFDVRDDQDRCFGDVTKDENGIVSGAEVPDANGMVIGTLSGNRDHSFEIRHVQRGGGSGFRMYWYDYGQNRWELYAQNRLINLQQTVYELVDAPIPKSEMEDYIVRVKACELAPEDDANCKLYGEGNREVYKPAGLLQQYGDDDQMLFGLLTGSFNKPTKGGVLRKNVGSLTDEINLETGQFTKTVGILDTIDRLRIATFDGGNYTYSNCGWITTMPLSDAGDGKCADWGNPIAEMMYETVRYFAGKEKPTGAFATKGGTDGSLKLPAPDWQDPYTQDKGDVSVCSKPNMLVIGDVNPSYDTDQLPGTAFKAKDFSGSDLDEPLDVAKEAKTIWNLDVGGNKKVFVGETVNDSDFAPTLKNANSFATIRGIAPEDPSKQGGWYAASVAYYGLKTDLNDANGDQNIRTFAVAMASPLPRIEIPIYEVSGSGDDAEFGDIINTVTLVPFAKSVGGSGINAAEGKYQPTNTIVDFYIEELQDDYGKFRINFEDVEQGADHDMDMIVEYIYRVTDMKNRIIEVEMNSTYAAGGIKQHAGYVIDGVTSRNKVFLEVRDVDTGENNDVNYFLDTPDNNDPLPLNTTRTFKAVVEDPPEILKDPLWYAAKWGNFNNAEEDPENPEENPEPDLQTEWDSDNDGDPDNYFLVTNALYLSEQLSAAFEEIRDQVSAAAGATASSTRLETDLMIYASEFTSGVWTGDMLAFRVDPDTRRVRATPVWRAANRMPEADARRIYTPKGRRIVEFRWSQLSNDMKNDLIQDDDAETGELRLEFLRGDQSQEERAEPPGPFRARVEDLNNSRENVLGDIINSTAAYVADGNFGYAALSDRLGGAEYADFLSNTAANRRPMVYVSANDGMLHAFDGTDDPDDGGVESWAYIPSMMFSELHKLTDPDYQHQYYLDGSPRTVDAYFRRGGSRSWGTMLVGSLGAAGSGIFAIDVTDPEDFGSDNVLWEYSEADDSDFGVVLGQGVAVPMADNDFRVVVGNGYNSANNKAALFILDASTGRLVKKITVPAPTNKGPNGLGTPLPVDFDGDRVTDTIYAADLLGNLWKFDVSGDKSSQWGVALGGKPLFDASSNPDADGPQPITARPAIAAHPDGGAMLLFGTGRYFVEGDEVLPEPADRELYTFYGIHDDLSGTTVDFDELLEQTITDQGDFNPEDPTAEVFREVSMNEPDPDKSYRGWYLDLVYEPEGRMTERVVVEPLVLRDFVVFVTLVPSEEACSFGGNSWIMIVDAFFGSQSDEPILDTNGDGIIDENDESISGIRSQVGILSKPVPVTNPDGSVTLIGRGNRIDGGGGDDDDDDDDDDDCPPGFVCDDVKLDTEGGRQAWRQVK